MALDNIPVWTIPPNWVDGVNESLEWLTGILASPVGAEQRMALRATPRRSFEMTFTKTHGPIRELFDMFVERVGGADIYVPLWHDSNHIAVSADAGTSYLEFDTTLRTEFRDNPAVFIQGSNPWDYEIAELAGEIDVRLVLADPLQRTWLKGARIFPMQKCRIEVMPQATRKADRMYQVRVKFSSLNPNPTRAPIVFTKYNGQFVLETEPNDVQDLTYEYQRIVAELDNQTGLRTRNQLNLWGSTVQQFTFYAKTRIRHEFLRAFFYQLQGRRFPIWIPTFFHDFDIVEDITANSLTFDVKRCGFTDFGGPFRGRQHILIHLRDRTRIYRKIVSSVLIGDGSTERITLSRKFLTDISVDEIRRVSFMAICRLDQDNIEIMHHTDTHGVSTVTTLFRSIPQVRAIDAIDAPHRIDAEESTGGGDDDVEPPLPDTPPDASLLGLQLGGGTGRSIYPPFGPEPYFTLVWDHLGGPTTLDNNGATFPGGVRLPTYGSFSAHAQTKWREPLNGPQFVARIRIHAENQEESTAESIFKPATELSSVSIPRTPIEPGNPAIILRVQSQMQGANLNLVAESTVPTIPPGYFEVKWWNT